MSHIIRPRRLTVISSRECAHSSVCAVWNMDLRKRAIITISTQIYIGWKKSHSMSMVHFCFMAVIFLTTANMGAFNLSFENSLGWTSADYENIVSNMFSVECGSNIIKYGAGIILILLGFNNIWKKINGQKNREPVYVGSSSISDLKFINKITLELYHKIRFSYNNPVATKQVIELLQICPMSINIQMSHNGYTPFLKACVSGCEEIIIQMLKNGADINICTVKGDGPFFLAVFAIITKKISDFSILKILINAGCPVNQAKQSGYTAMHLAARCGHHQLVRWLLINGADPDPKTSAISPYLMAKKYGHEETASLLFINLGPGGE